jgi:hypothetical protein
VPTTAGELLELLRAHAVKHAIGLTLAVLVLNGFLRLAEGSRLELLDRS